MNGRSRILARLAGEPVDRLPLMPITMMLAADQIGRPYGEYAADHRVLVEGQLATAEKFDFDYVSCISDPAREAADCGAAVKYFDNQPPALDDDRALLADPATLKTLCQPDPLAGRMGDRVRAAALFKERVGGERLIEGWIEGPCAEAADLRGIQTLMTDFFDEPGFVRDLFEFILEMELNFARAQVEAGAEIMGIGDAAASLVGPRVYDEFVFEYEKRLIEGVHVLGVPVRLHICGNIGRILKGIGQLNADLIDVDYPVPMSKARAEIGPAPVLAGNLNPVQIVRDGPPPLIRETVARCHQEAGERYIVAAGCELPRGTPDAHIRALAEYAAGTT